MVDLLIKGSEVGNLLLKTNLKALILKKNNLKIGSEEY
jgi:hypothetical protein